MITNINVKNTLFGKFYWMNPSNTFFFKKSYHLYDDYVYKDVFYLKNYRYRGVFNFSYNNDTKVIISNISIKNNPNIDNIHNTHNIHNIDLSENFKTKLTTFLPIEYTFYKNNLLTNSKDIENIIREL